ncbi:chemotaxis protein CheA [Phaeobacter sp. HF9A]|uniref:chemotaxis protein CheA n=1 Tax=Phaeobacter sp. HF9A TaxID=2721561 RepID=UPI00142FDB03|nr:chemotaxis protein CheA [Phaeobacter sp. HF9A]NIZ13099.1 chemotaxis protein CheA [Phaeobacter sp. HF9A]
MYEFSTPPLGVLVNLPGAIASANGPQAAALSLSNTDSLTTNQLQNHVAQARRARNKLIDQVSKPPQPGWKVAMEQISDTVTQMERVLTFLQTQTGALPAKPAEDMNAIAVFPSGDAMQQSGKTPERLPSAVETPTAPFSAATAADRAPRVIYVMDEGVMILGRPEGPSPAASQRRETRTEAASQAAPATSNRASATIVALPLTEEQQRASADLITLARNAYEQLQRSQPDREAAALVTDRDVGLTGNLSQDPAAPPSPERVDLTQTAGAVDPARSSPAQAAPKVPTVQDALLAPVDPFEETPAEEAAAPQEAQRILALQLDGAGDIIYIVPPAKAAMDLIA